MLIGNTLKLAFVGELPFSEEGIRQATRCTYKWKAVVTTAGVMGLDPPFATRMSTTVSANIFSNRTNRRGQKWTGARLKRSNRIACSHYILAGLGDTKWKDIHSWPNVLQPPCGDNATNLLKKPRFFVDKLSSMIPWLIDVSLNWMSVFQLSVFFWIVIFCERKR